jgi:hypothetical protein
MQTFRLLETVRDVCRPQESLPDPQPVGARARDETSQVPRRSSNQKQKGSQVAAHRDLGLVVLGTLAVIDRLLTGWFVSLGDSDTAKRVDRFLTGDTLCLPSFDGRASLL